MQDTELIEACAHNDRAAQKAFYDRYSATVMGMCTRYSGGEKEAGGMATYVFQKLFENISTCPVDGTMERWLEQKVIWNAINYLHQDKHKYFIAKTTLYVENKPVYTMNIEDAVLPDDVGKRLYLNALQALTPSYRILYNLTYIDEVPHAEIIKNLAIAEETYKTELSEAKYQYKKLLTMRLNEQRVQ